MYVVKKAGKCLTEKVSFPRHSWQASHCSVNTALEAFSVILQKVLECLQKENRKKRKCFVFLSDKNLSTTCIYPYGVENYPDL